MAVNKTKSKPKGKGISGLNAFAALSKVSGKANKKAAKPLKKAKGSARPVSSKKSGPKIAVFVDLDNTNASRDNLLELFSNLARKGTITYGKFYGYSDDKVNDFDEIVAEYRLETAGVSRFKSAAASVIDTRLIVDCLIFAEKNNADMVFVWAGVGDLIPVFMRLIHLGCKTLTVDLPDFDCNNKFVDEKIKLFSPHSLHGPRAASVSSYQAPSNPVRSEETSESDSEDEEAPTASISAFDTRNIPKLPRKKGAPEFGAAPSKTEVINESSYDDFDEEEEEQDHEDDFSEDNFDLDTDDEGEEEYEDEDDGSEEMNITENERMLALTEELLRNIQAGKSIDSIDVKKLNINESSAPAARGPVSAPAPAAKPADKPAGKPAEKPKKSGGFGHDNPAKYDAEEEPEKPEQKPFEQDEFSGFGDL